MFCKSGEKLDIKSKGAMMKAKKRLKKRVSAVAPSAREKKKSSFRGACLGQANLYEPSNPRLRDPK